MKKRVAMLKLDLGVFKRAFFALVCVGLLASPVAQTTAVAATVSDPGLAALKASLLKEMSAAAQASTQRQATQDATARASGECSDIDTTARNAAAARISRLSPPDPTKIIQNTTCFVDVATVQIPVILTGIGFIDAIIKEALQRFMTGSCQKASGFLSDLKSSALTQLNSNTGGTANLLLNYANTATAGGSTTETAIGASLGTLQQSGSSLTSGLLGGATSVSSGTGLSDAQTQLSNSMAQISSSYQATAAQFLCSMNIADATYCPTCESNPNHASCLPPRPYCGSAYPNVSPPQCIEYYSGD